GFRYHRIPCHAIGGGDQRKSAVHRIAHGDSVRAVPEGKAIVKSLGIAVGELPLPYPATVRGLINTRLIARADAEHERGVLVKGLNVAKVERVRAGDDQCLPVLAAINGPQDRSFGSAGPCHLAGNRADATKLDVSPAVL